MAVAGEGAVVPTAPGGIVGFAQTPGRIGIATSASKPHRVYALVDSAEVLVVLGSSLTVMSGLRFVRHQAKQSRPSAIINRGWTRGDDLATLKVEAGCSETLTALRDLLLSH